MSNSMLRIGDITNSLYVGTNMPENEPESAKSVPRSEKGLSLKKCEKWSYRVESRGAVTALVVRIFLRTQKTRGGPPVEWTETASTRHRHEKKKKKKKRSYVDVPESFLDIF